MARPLRHALACPALHALDVASTWWLLGNPGMDEGDTAAAALLGRWGFWPPMVPLALAAVVGSNLILVVRLPVPQWQLG